MTQLSSAYVLRGVWLTELIPPIFIELKACFNDAKSNSFPYYYYDS